MVTVPEGDIVAAMQWATAAKASWGFSLAMILFIATLWLFFLGASWSSSWRNLYMVH